MSIPVFYALLMIIALYLVIRLQPKPDKNYQRLINRTGKRLANQMIRDVQQKYPSRGRDWVIRKVLADLDKGKV